MTEKLRYTILKWLYGVGYVLLMLGVVFYFAAFKIAPFVYSFGVLLLIIGRVVLPIDSSDSKTKRLNMIHAFATLVLLASAYGMFIRYYLWLPGLLLATILDLYISFRLPKKENP